MRVRRVSLLVIGVTVLAGCATDTFYDSPGLVPAWYEQGEVIELEVVGPRIEAYCEFYCESYPKRYNLLELREEHGTVEFTEQGRALFAIEPVPPGANPALTPGHTVHTSILLTNGKKITVIGKQDIGLNLGEVVQLGFGDSSSRTEAEKIVLRQLD